MAWPDRARWARSAISASSRLLSGARLGRVSALGTIGISASTVVHDTSAVHTFTRPEKRYHGCQKIVASIRWPKPQKKMKAANSQKMGRNGTSRRRQTKHASTQGMAV